MKVKELIDIINSNEYPSLHHLETIKGLPECVAEGLDLDQYRWFSIATNVYKCEDGFVGVCGAYQSFSEMQTWKDLDAPCEAEEYEEISTVSYKPKK